MGIDLQGKAGIVTGGGHGIGRAYCLGLAREGAGVVIADIDLPAAEETKGLIEKAGGRALAVKVDVADEKSTLEMAETLLNAHRRVRTASRIKGIRYRVEPHLPPDVLGIYVYLPVA